MGVGIAFIYGPLLIIFSIISVFFSIMSIRSRHKIDAEFKASLSQITLGLLAASGITIIVTSLLVTYLYFTVDGKDIISFGIGLLTPNLFLPILVALLLKTASLKSLGTDSSTNQKANRLLNISIGAANSVWFVPGIFVWAFSFWLKHKAG